MLTHGIFESRFFRCLDVHHPLVRLLAQLAPQYLDLLGQLDEIADLPSGFVPAEDAGAPEDWLWQLYGEILTINRGFQPKFSGIEEDFGREKRQLEDGGKIAVSVIIPCYNQGEFILDAIASVEDCWDDVWELIVVDDGSTERLTRDVLEYLQGHGYLVIAQGNHGLAKARNVGIERARGRYILPLDADNRIKPDYIRKGIEILDKYPQVGVVYGNGDFFGERQGIWEVPDFDLERLLRGNYIDACAVFRKQVWADCGGYDGDMPERLGFEDWDLWLGAAAKGWQFYRIPEVMFGYRVRSGSMVSTCRLPGKRFQLVSYICAKHRDLYMAENRFARTIAHLMAP
ncbi:MAG TPA: glycosyltransferase [Oscillatoriaceae cyanobacterium M33_DOE_052]|uniref:Glycosyltransferase n=1 Tax=Planktothricoides sp. SpSt-374 TaxID=2282167 RepID=A0A7C3ZMD7_9CYAN|nr:glycosyltransferase [Oscillatoriaceae cyanobacterium M33_DOE_052]